MAERQLQPSALYLLLPCLSYGRAEDLALSVNSPGDCHFCQLGFNLIFVTNLSLFTAGLTTSPGLPSEVDSESGKLRFGLGSFGSTAFRQEVAAWVRLVI